MSQISEHHVQDAESGIWVSVFAFFERIFQRGDLKATLVATEVQDDFRQSMAQPPDVIEHFFMVIRAGT